MRNYFTSRPVSPSPSQNDRKSCHIVPDGIVDHWWHGDNCVFLQYGPECNTHNTNIPSGCIRLRFSWGAPCGKRAPTGWHRKSFDLDGASRRTMFTLPVECAKGNQRLQWCKSLTKQPCKWDHTQTLRIRRTKEQRSMGAKLATWHWKKIVTTDIIMPSAAMTTNMPQLLRVTLPPQ